jgi:5-methyltetrahydrofolate--homocysteine methyltransferase
MTRALVRHSSGRYPVSVTLMRGPADILSAMRGAQNYVWDMIDEPELMEKIAVRLADVYIYTAKKQLELIPDCPEGYICGDQGMRIWQPQKFIWLQGDALSLLSPTLYQQTIQPAERKILEAFGHAAYHLHFNCLWMIDFLLDMPQIDAIELNLESATIDLDATFAGWKKIQCNKPLVVWAQYDPDSFADWMGRFLKEIPPQGVNFQIALFDHDAEQGINVRKIYEQLAANNS